VLFLNIGGGRLYARGRELRRDVGITPKAGCGNSYKFQSKVFVSVSLGDAGELERGRQCGFPLQNGMVLRSVRVRLGLLAYPPSHW